ncbi:MAG TPA: hypothetical protein VF006_33925 [Longimicrobium sp.]
MRVLNCSVFAVLALGAVVAGCSSGGGTEPLAGPATLLVEDFNQEGGGSYQLNYTGFARWNVTGGSVDLVGTPPFDDFLSTAQGMYVDLDGTTRAAGTLESKETFALPRGTYQLQFKLAGTPRPSQPDNTVTVSLGNVYQETFTLPSYAPLQTFTRSIPVLRDTSARLRFQHEGGDDYGIFVDDIQLSRR